MHKKLVPGMHKQLGPAIGEVVASRNESAWPEEASLAPTTPRGSSPEPAGADGAEPAPAPPLLLPPPASARSAVGAALGCVAALRLVYGAGPRPSGCRGLFLFSLVFLQRRVAGTEEWRPPGGWEDTYSRHIRYEILL